MVKVIEIEEVNRLKADFLDMIPQLIRNVHGLSLIEKYGSEQKRLDNDSLDDMFLVSHSEYLINYGKWNEIIGFDYGSIQNGDLKKLQGFPFISLAYKMVNELGITNISENDEMHLFFPNIKNRYVGSLYGTVDIGARTQIGKTKKEYQQKFAIHNLIHGPIQITAKEQSYVDAPLSMKNGLGNIVLDMFFKNKLFGSEKIKLFMKEERYGKMPFEEMHFNFDRVDVYRVGEQRQYPTKTL